MSNNEMQAEKALSVASVFGKVPVSVAWAGVIAVGGVVFASGQHFGESSMQEKLSAVSIQLAKVEAEKIVQTERAQQAAEKQKLMSDNLALLNTQLVDRERQLSALGARVERANTCEFLQRQVADLERQISNIRSGRHLRAANQIILMSDSETVEKRNQERKALDEAEIAHLQQRVLAFTQQLGACTK